MTCALLKLNTSSVLELCTRTQTDHIVRHREVVMHSLLCDLDVSHA